MVLFRTAAAHVSDEVLQCAKDLGIVVELLFAGMTAIMQPCDIWLNKKNQNCSKKSVLSIQERTET